MKINKKSFSIILIFVLLCTILGANVCAATGYQGYAVYRDGVALNLNWHAALMDGPSSTSILPVTQAPGGNLNVQWDTWDNFMNGKNFQGVYRPNVQPSSTDRDNFVAMGRQLISDYIPYSLTYQVTYDVYGQTGRTWVFPADITGMRCDGVVEYIYEYYGFRVFGSDSNWDVSKWQDTNLFAHAIGGIQPKSQAQNYLTLITTQIP